LGDGRGPESRYKVEECCFNTIFGTFQGHRIFASRKLGENIEMQPRYAAELFNVDVRQDQRYLAEKDLFPCGDRDESRFSLEFDVHLSSLESQVAGDPNLKEKASTFALAIGARLHLPRYLSFLIGYNAQGPIVSRKVFSLTDNKSGIEVEFR
jgi:hypothetical protein